MSTSILMKASEMQPTTFRGPQRFSSMWRYAPLLLYTLADDRVHDFDAHGVPFGLFSGSGYGSPQQIRLAPGDMLILITDGFLEWMNSEDEEFGLSRVQEVLLSTKDLPPDEIISRLYSAVITFSGGTQQQDDLTAVILKRNRE